MKRGEIWTLQGGGYASKPRPAIILQAELDHSFNSVVLCLFTSFTSDDISTRVRIEPNESNGLQCISFVMTEKLLTVEKNLFGEKIGALTGEQMHEISRQLAKILQIEKEDIDEER